MPAASADARTARLIAAYEALDRARLPALLDLYDAQARFKDPFNEVQGRPAIERLFVHMFDALAEPHFVVHTAVTEGDDAFLTWDFHFRRRQDAPPMQIRGASHLRYGPDGRVTWHRDYWDAAEELYAKLPLLGGLMRWLQRRLATPNGGV